MRGLRSRTVADLVALTVVWGIIVLLVNPSGNFPLDDDWSYGRAVQALVDRHEFSLTGFTAMPLVAQVVWGALFCLPAGFSFTALRVSTLVLALVGILATYGLLRTARAERPIALAGALLIATNPLYCLLAFTFMTDVPFLAFSTLAVLFLARGVVRTHKHELAIGFLAAGTALLIRQPAIVILVAFGVAYLLSHGINRSTLLVAVAPSAVAAGILLGYKAILKATIGVPVLYNRPYDPLSETASGAFEALGQFVDRLFVAGIYLGLFLFPLTIVVAARHWQVASGRVRMVRLFATLVLAGAASAWLLVSDRLMPLSGNIIYDETGLGPPLLRDVYILGLPHVDRAPREVWLVVTGAGVFGAAVLAQQIFSAVLAIARRLTQRELPSGAFVATLTLAASALYLGSIAIAGYLDRYLLFALPLVVAAVVATEPFSPRPRFALALATVAIGVLGFVSVAGTHDYLSWNRARWAALRQLTDERNVSYREIDGGFEFNGWYAYRPGYREKPGKSAWWVDDDTYQLAFGPVPGYRIVERYAYRSWIRWSTGHILVLRRQ